MEEFRKTLRPNPAENANFFSKIFFCYVNGFLRYGYSHELETEDLHACRKSDESQVMSAIAERNWYSELGRARKAGREPSLFRVLARQFGPRYMLYGCLQLLENVLLLVQPIFMGRLIRYFRVGGEMEKAEAYSYAAAIATCGAAYSMIHHPYFFNVQRVGMQLRVTSSTLIFRKALRLSSAAMQKTTVGHIVNLLSNDVARFDFAVIFLHNIWVCPIVVVGFAVLLWQQMGPSCLAGFGCMILLVPIQGTFSRLMGKFRAGIAVKADKRVGIMSEILNGIRVIKMYAWEKPFSDLLLAARREEVGVVRKMALSQGMVMALFFATYHLVVLCAVVAFVLSGNEMSAEKIFVAAALFNSARLQLTLFLPFALMNIFETRVTLRRITAFLLLEENEACAQLSLEKSAVEKEPLGGTELTPLANGDAVKKRPAEEPFVRLHNFSGKWEEAAEKATLDSVSLSASPGQLIVVIGPVGSGKSSLISAVLGELGCGGGSLEKSGRLGYVPQEAWVFSASLRQNVLFGADFDSERYQQTLRSCALAKDLKQLSHGDSSLVGDRGVALSGGQKARLNLARAVYRDADIYLLDDPLSAVDAAVGRFLFQKCIRGQLRDKVVILVTHQLQYLPQADKIVVLKEGRVVAQGTYDELQALGDQFMSIVKETEESYSKRHDSQSSENVSSPRSRQVSRTLSRGNSHQEDGTKVTFRGSREFSTEAEALLEEDENVARKVAGKAGVGSMSASAWSLAMGVDTPIEAQAPEERSVGSVSMGVYFEYFKRMAAHPLLLIPLGIFIFFTQALFNACDYWLKIWANQAEYDSWMARNASGLVVDNGTLSAKLQPGPFPELSTNDYLYIYIGLILSLLAASITRSLWFRYAQTVSSLKLHDRMFTAILGSPVAFFDRNPVGRILNRFSKDVGVMDEQLGFSCYDFIQGLIQFLAVLLVVGYLNPAVFIPTAPLACVFIFLRFYYLKSARQIKRLEAAARSPVFTHISASLNGLSTIRAFGAESSVLNNFYQYQDIHSAAFGIFLSTMRWFAVVIDWLSALYIAAVAFLTVYTADGSERSGEVGLMLFYAVSIVGALQWTLRQSAELETGLWPGLVSVVFASGGHAGGSSDSGGVALSLFYSMQLLGMLAHYMNQWANLETQMVSVERIIGYSRLEVEGPMESVPERRPKEEWPRYGELLFDALSLRYSVDGPWVLKDISCRICPAEKIGIVGRTGAGKSSLVGALFRLTPYSGTLAIDGLDSAAVGLSDLRRRISIIPQDPVLFIGSLRQNLDPFDEYDDDELWVALDQVQLKPAVQAMPQALLTHMQEGGANLSVGQKQLVCLARALLKQARVLVIDEATANVDLHTDALIQEKIRTCFAESTVLTIAHRLNTVMDSDRVMVLDGGRLVEMDAPHLLLQKEPASAFRGLVEETGAAAELCRLAKASYEAKKEKEAGSEV